MLGGKQANAVRIIRLNAKPWRTNEDVYSALLNALESFSGHGHNFNALWDSLTEGAKHDLGPDPGSYLNGVQPPFHIDVANADTSPPAVQEMLKDLADLFAEAKAQYGVRISIALWPSLRVVKGDALNAPRP